MKRILLCLLVCINASGQPCVDSSECDDGLVCQRDLNGRGACVTPSIDALNVEISNGKSGQHCTFPSDCDSGICLRPHGYTSYGVCK